MEVINRKSKEVILNGGRAKTRCYVLVERHRVYFTAAVTRMCELKVGLFVHFLNDGPNWKFFVNDDPDGFALTPVVSKGGFHANNTGLTSMILKSTGHKGSKRFNVLKTPNFHDSCSIFEMSLENVSSVNR